MSSRALSCIALLIAAPSAYAVPVEPATALSMAAERDPTLRAALLAAQQARQAVMREAHGFVPTFTAEVGLTSSTTPSLSQQGIRLAGRDDISARLAIEKPFAVGTRLGAELTLNGATQDFVQPDLADTLTLGPNYGLNLTLRLTQPLLRGFGVDAGEAALRGAKQAQTAAERARDQVASALARDVLMAWWQLWSAQAVVTNQKQGLTVAERQLKEIQDRIEIGSLPPSDALPLRTQVALVREALATARITVRQRQSALAQLTSGDASASIQATPGPAATADLPSVEAVAEAARANAPELPALVAAVAQARIQAAVSANAALPQLDAATWISAAGLGKESTVDALSMTARGEALSGYVGLSLSLPVDNDGREADAERARLAVQAAQTRLQAARESASAQAVFQLETAYAAQVRLVAAMETTTVATEAAEAARARHEAGADTALAWVVAEQDRREAALRVVQARADLAIGKAALAHLTGELLARNADAGPATP